MNECFPPINFSARSYLVISGVSPFYCEPLYIGPTLAHTHVLDLAWVEFTLSIQMITSR